MTLSGAYFQNQVEAAERRETVAHGGSRGLCRSQLSAPGGVKDSMSGRNFLPPHRGGIIFVRLSHGCRRGLLSCALPALKRVI